MKGPLTLMKPLKQRSKSALTTNMFQDPDKIEDTPMTSRENIQHYDFVGPQQIRKKLITKNSKPLKIEEKINQVSLDQTPLNQTTTSKNPFNTTINRDTMFDSLHREQQIEYTRQTRNIQRFKEYQQHWAKQKGHIKVELNKKNPILMDNNIKHLYVHPNEPKIDTINHYIVQYWEMSLRNNNPILERHIKGHRFDKVEKERLLQLRDGIKKVESSIPVLPTEKLAKLKIRELSLNGRNKIKRELQTESYQNQTRYSVPTTSRNTQQEVFKIDYEGCKKWMGAEKM